MSGEPDQARRVAFRDPGQLSQPGWHPCVAGGTGSDLGCHGVRQRAGCREDPAAGRAALAAGEFPGRSGGDSAGKFGLDIGGYHPTLPLNSVAVDKDAHRWAIIRAARSWRSRWSASAVAAPGSWPSQRKAACEDAQ